AVPGLTNRLLARLVKAAAVTYEESVPFFSGKAFVAGNPVRPEFFNTEEAHDDRRSPPGAARVLVFGGSQGAHAINVALVEAATLAELAAAGRAAILVPLPTATDDHQRRNAEALVRQGAAVMIEQRELTGERLAADVLALARDPARRAGLARAARQLARPDAARAIVERALELVRKRI